MEREREGGPESALRASRDVYLVLESGYTRNNPYRMAMGLRLGRNQTLVTSGYGGYTRSRCNEDEGPRVVGAKEGA
jgi:hypothetical protein